MDKIGLTIEEATEYTSIGRDTIRRLIEWGKLPVLHIGARRSSGEIFWRSLWKSISAWIC